MVVGAAALGLDGTSETGVAAASAAHILAAGVCRTRHRLTPAARQLPSVVAAGAVVVHLSRPPPRHSSTNLSVIRVLARLAGRAAASSAAELRLRRPKKALWTSQTSPRPSGVHQLEALPTPPRRQRLCIARHAGVCTLATSSHDALRLPRHRTSGGSLGQSFFVLTRHVTVVARVVEGIKTISFSMDHCEALVRPSDSAADSMLCSHRVTG